jgi:acetolactate synthase-1/2/3 large subunit
MSTTRGADVVVEALVGAGVRQLFTVSGNHVLSIYDATIGRDVALVHTRHEAAAVHMADAWGRLTERPGVVLVTAGPGHANALGALYTALMAESPVVLLSGHCPRGEIGAGGFQEMEQVAMARPVTKAAWLCDEPDRMAQDIETALALAASGRPGPVHVSLPGDLLDARVSASHGRGLTREPAARLDRESIAALLGLLARAERPLILVGPAQGRGARSGVVSELATVTGAAVLPIESPRGVNDPWLRGATAALGEADVVLLIGKPLDFSLRFGAAPPFAAEARFAQVALGAPVPAKCERIAVAVSADAAVAAEQLLAAARSRAWRGSEWRERVSRMRLASPAGWASARTAPASPIHPLRVCAALEPYAREDAVVVSDGGEFGQWVQAGLEPRERIINGLSGSIGSALPMALGARLACPDRPVIATVGDGTFGYHALEIDTAVRHGLPIVVVVGNDARWNAEHQLQLKHYGADRAIGCDLLPSRYDLVATALGGHGEHVSRADDLEPALARAFASGRPAVVNVMIDGVAAPVFR